jgi:hypothetical protein
LLSTAVTRTYFPPICAMTLAYSFSAPTATTVPVLAEAVLVAELAVQAAVSRLTAAAAATSAAAAAARRGAARVCRAAAAVLITNENDNQYGGERQAGPRSVRSHVRHASHSLGRAAAGPPRA